MQRLLQAEPHGRVHTDGATVTKTFLGADRLADAEEEFRRLGALSSLLAGRAGIACPSPLGLDPGPPPELSMTFASGEPVDAIAAAGDLTAAEIDAVGRAAAALAAAHVEATGVAYADLHLRNLLYDRPAGRVTAVDLGDPHALGDRQAARASLDPVEAALANLVAGVVFDLLRPRAALRRDGRTTALALAAAALDGAGLGRAARGAVVEEARATIESLTRTGSLLRRTWFATGGRVAGRPGTALAGLA